MFTAQTSLMEICLDYYFPRKISIRSSDTRKQYLIAIRDFAESLGRPPTLADLDDDALVLWMSHMLDKGLSVVTTRERAGRIKSLWNWLAKRRIVDLFPTFERPPAPEPSPQAWREDELRRLFDEAQYEYGHIEGIPARNWWRAHLAWFWYTSERTGATFALRREWIDLDRRLARIPASVRKGRRKPAVYELPEPLIEALRAIWEPPRELVFPWPFHQGTYYYRFGRILRRAGLPCDRRRKGQGLRVSHASWVDSLGGDATRALLHSDPMTTRRHYIDPSLKKQDETKLFRPW